MDEDGSAESRNASLELGRRVARAREGDEDSITWLYLRLAPLLSLQARYRLQGRLRNACDPEDLVNETWTVFLDRLPDLRGEPEDLGRVALSFLTRTLGHKVLTLDDQVRRRPHIQRSSMGSGSSFLQPLDRLVGGGPASTEIQGLEFMEALERAVQSLDDPGREVVVLRALEQRPNEEVARLLGLTPAGATRRYQRALEQLRQRVPGSALDWLLRD